jgi:hypothetical protein
MTPKSGRTSLTAEERQQAMSEQIKRREPGKRAFPSREHARPKLTLVPPQQPIRPDASAELSQAVKEMLREMNRRHAASRSTDEPDAA